MKIRFIKRALLVITSLLGITISAFSQKKMEKGFLGKADLYNSKKAAFEYLNRGDIVEKYGRISDSIWFFAELGMQEFRSSAILIRTLESEGFKVEKGVDKYG